MQQVNKPSSRIIFGEELAFDDAKHRYLYAGMPVPSVTTILQTVAKPVLVPWAVKMTSEHWLGAVKAGRTDFDILDKESRGIHRKKASDAASIGTNVHHYAECFFKKLPLPILQTDEAKRGADAFHKWAEATNVEVLAVERRIYSKEFGYAGTVDLVARINGILSVADYKTSSGIYPEMRLQTAAYQHALQEEKKMEFGPRWIIRFDKKTGEFEDKAFPDFESDFSGFKGALLLHRSLKAMTEKKK
jgi:hypothetical protein